MNGRVSELRLLGGLLLAGWIALQSPPARGDIDDAEYEVRVGKRTASERLQLQREFEEQRRQEEEKVRLEAEANARQAVVDVARRAALPLPQRLTESRCTACHDAKRFQQQAHTWPGWLAVVLRMKYINQAPLEAGEIPLIVGHLAATHTAGGSDAVLEYAAVPSLLVVAVLPMYWHRRRVKVRRHA